MHSRTCLTCDFWQIKCNRKHQTNSHSSSGWSCCLPASLAAGPQTEPPTSWFQADLNLTSVALLQKPNTRVLGCTRKGLNWNADRAQRGVRCLLEWSAKATKAAHQGGERAETRRRESARAEYFLSIAPYWLRLCQPLMNSPAGCRRREGRKIRTVLHERLSALAASGQMLFLLHQRSLCRPKGASAV